MSGVRAPAPAGQGPMLGLSTVSIINHLPLIHMRTPAALTTATTPGLSAMLAVHAPPINRSALAQPAPTLFSLAYLASIVVRPVIMITAKYVIDHA